MYILYYLKKYLIIYTLYTFSDDNNCNIENY